MIGFILEIRLQRWVNFSGLPKDSRYSIITSVSISSSQNCSKSLPDTSILLPKLTKFFTPIPIEFKCFTRYKPSAPEWLAILIEPKSGLFSKKEAFIVYSGLLFIIPKLYGPIILLPAFLLFQLIVIYVL